jgi:hypothetical protein
MKIKLKPQPKIGDTRTLTKFAFFPIIINGYLVWLEKYTIEQELIDSVWYDHDNEGRAVHCVHWSNKP